jgi:hypothetical protein
MTYWNGNYNRRQNIAIDASAVTKGSFDLEIIIPEDWDDFWDNIRSDGLDIVLVSSMGAVGTFQFKAGFNLTNRSLTLQVQNYTVGEDYKTGNVFVYWDYPSESTDRKSAFSLGGSVLNGSIFLGQPIGRLINSVPVKPISSEPVAFFQKQPDEKTDIWFPAGQVLMPRRSPYNQRFSLNEISWVLGYVYNTSGVAQPSMIASTEIKITANWVGLRIQAGTTATNYTVSCRIRTTDAEEIILSAGLNVQTILAS